MLAFEDATRTTSLPVTRIGNNVYEVTVVVTDSKGNTDEQEVTVKVTNMEEDGMVTLSTLQPRVGFPVTATLADPDNITAGSVSWQWYKGRCDAAGLGDSAMAMNASLPLTTSQCFNQGRRHLRHIHTRF